MLSGLWHRSLTQTHGGVGQYLYITPRHSLTIVPVVYFQSSNNWYAEGRYNYEALKTLSVYAGKVFEKEATVSYSVSPIIGAVLGQFNGGSVGANGELNYHRLFFSSQLQYTFSAKHHTENFLYSWSDLSYQILNNIYTGISVQQTNLYKLPSRLEEGFFIKALFNKWTMPLYFFNPASKQRYFVLGLTRDW